MIVMMMCSKFEYSCCSERYQSTSHLFLFRRRRRRKYHLARRELDDAILFFRRHGISGSRQNLEAPFDQHPWINIVTKHLLWGVEMQILQFMTAKGRKENMRLSLLYQKGGCCTTRSLVQNPGQRPLNRSACDGI